MLFKSPVKKQIYFEALQKIEALKSLSIFQMAMLDELFTTDLEGFKKYLIETSTRLSPEEIEVFVETSFKLRNPYKLKEILPGKVQTFFKKESLCNKDIIIVREGENIHTARLNPDGTLQSKTLSNGYLPEHFNQVWIATYPKSKK